MSAGIEPPECVFAHGWLLVGGEKMSKTRLNQIAPADLVADFGVDGFRYHFMADQRFGPDGDFSYEAMVAALQRRPREQLRQPREPGAEHGGAVFRWRGNRRAARRPAPQHSVLGVRRDDGGDGRARLRVPFGQLWDLIRATNAYIEDQQPWALNKAGDTAAVAAVLGDCLEVVAHRCVAGVAGHPERVRRIVAAARPCRDGPRINGFPMPRGGVRCLWVLTSRRARRCSRARTPSDRVGRLALPPAARGW